MAGPRVTAMVFALAMLLAGPAYAGDDLVAVGETVAGYRLEHVERHPEYLRLHFAGAGKNTVLEIGRVDDAPGPWSTARHRLMPAPGQEPPEALMLAVMERLRSHDAASGARLVRERIGGTANSPLDPAPGPPSPLTLVACALAGLAWGLALSRERSLHILKRIEKHLDARPWPYLAALLAAVAVPRLLELDTPFSADAMTQRLFFGSLDVGDIVAHSYADQRHPQLFYLVLHAFLWLGHGESVARLPAVLFSLGSLAMLFVLARQRLGAGPALVATALFGLNSAYLLHSREVSDLTLFTLLALGSTHLLLRSIDEPRAPTLVALALVETAMFYTYYLAALVALVHLATALFQARQRQRPRAPSLALGAAWVLAAPSLVELLALVRDDRAVRDVARVFPVHMWGERTAGQLLAEAGALFAPAPWALALMGLLAVIGTWRLGPRPWRDPLVSVALPLIVLTIGVLGAAVAVVRLKPYYLLFALPFLLVLVVAGAPGPRAPDRPRSRRSALGAGAGLACTALLLVTHGAVLRHGIARILTPRSQPRFDELGAAIRTSMRQDPNAPRTVIADGNNMHTILVYYAFEDPLGMYRTCALDGRDGFGTRCRRGTDELVTLTLLPELRPGWEEQSVARLRQTQRGRASWVVYTERFPNEPLFRELEGHCELVARFGKHDSLDLFRCPERTANEGG